MLCAVRQPPACSVEEKGEKGGKGGKGGMERVHVYLHYSLIPSPSPSFPLFPVRLGNEATCTRQCDSLGSRGDSRRGWRSGGVHCQAGAGHLTGTQPVRKGGEEVASTVVYKVSNSNGVSCPHIPTLVVTLERDQGTKQ